MSYPPPMPQRPRSSSKPPGGRPSGKPGGKPSGKSKPGRGGRRPGPAERSDGRLELRNPHAAYEVLQRRPHDAVELLVAGDGGPAWTRVFAGCDEHRVAIRRLTADDSRDRRDRTSEGRRTGVALVVEPPPAARFNAMIAETKRDQPGLWLTLEQVQDVRNLGAIFRTAAFFGIRGIILTKDRSASLTAIACDTAAGGVETLPHCVVTNLARTLAAARDEYGLRIVGASEHATQPVADVATDVDTLLVLGNEEKGLRRLTREHCDVLTAIPGTGGIGSLNVSVAAGILIDRLLPR